MKCVACCLLFAVTVAPQQPCAIRGIVVDALTGQPLSRAQVFVEQTSDSDDPDDYSTPPIRQITDSRGAFCFQNLTNGDYGVRATKAFYIDAAYGERWPGDSSDILTVAAGEPLPPLTIKMNPQAVISGVLVDAEGDPLQSARIQLLKRSWKKRRLTTVVVEETTTDDEGKFRFAGLAAGTYFVNAISPLERNGSPVMHRQFFNDSRQPFTQREGRTFYKDAISFRDATPLHVEAGQQMSNLTLTIRAAETRHVSGQVPAGVLNTSPRVLYFSEEGTGARINVALQSDGRFFLDGLFPDRYVVQAPGIESKEIDLTIADTDNLALELNAPIELQITVHMEGVQSQTPIHGLVLADKTQDRADGDRFITAEMVSENKFKAAVRPGQYELETAGTRFPLFTRSITVDGVPRSPGVFDLSGSSPKSIDLFLSSNLASVKGRVIAEQPPHYGITLVVEDEADPDSFVVGQVAPSEFEWPVLRPGTYRLYAFEEFNRNCWGNPELAALFGAKSILLEVKDARTLNVGCR